jgi:hypothetical protein
MREWKRSCAGDEFSAEFFLNKRREPCVRYAAVPDSRPELNFCFVACDFDGRI